MRSETWFRPSPWSSVWKGRLAGRRNVGMTSAVTPRRSPKQQLPRPRTIKEPRFERLTYSQISHRILLHHQLASCCRSNPHPGERDIEHARSASCCRSNPHPGERAMERACSMLEPARCALPRHLQLRSRGSSAKISNGARICRNSTWKPLDIQRPWHLSINLGSLAITNASLMRTHADMSAVLTAGHSCRTSSLQV